MRRTSAIGVSAIFCFVALGCHDERMNHDLGSGDLLTTPDGSVSLDASSSQDSSAPSDLSEANHTGIECGTMTCNIGSTCCVVPDVQRQTSQSKCMSGTQCAVGAIPATCDGPEDCPQEAGNCCVNLILGNQNQISGSASCTASCPGSITASSSGDTLQTKFCHMPSDCAGFRGSTPLGDQDFDACCNFMGIPFQFCAPIALRNSTSKITCPAP
jgi:hypothetical protein